MPQLCLLYPFISDFSVVNPRFVGGTPERNQRFIEESIKRRDEQLTQAFRGLTEAASAKTTEIEDPKPKRRKWFRR